MPRRYLSTRRTEAVQETRRKILQATLQLHGERGIMATSWEDIARAAGVSLATVYRHFPTLNELVGACGAMAEELIRPPRAGVADSLLDGAESTGERVRRVVTELCAFYERGFVALSTVRREAHLVPPLAAWGRELDEVRAVLVRAATRPTDVTEPAGRVALALTAFPVWQALAEAGVPPGEAADVIAALVLCSLSGPAPD